MLRHLTFLQFWTPDESSQTASHATPTNTAQSPKSSDVCFLCAVWTLNQFASQSVQSTADLGASDEYDDDAAWQWGMDKLVPLSPT